MQDHRDRALVESVRRHLMEDGRLAGQAINVVSSAGYIQITGAVDTQEQRQLALELAKGVVGVRKVEDLLRVRQPKVA